VTAGLGAPGDDRHGEDDRALALAILRRHGHDVTSFQLLEPSFRYFFHGGGFVAYVDTGSAWVAGGGPVTPPERVASVARAFVDAARARGRRASFFAVSDAFVEATGFRRVRIGEQPLWDPARWEDVVREHASIRSQVRRARAKGVTVRRAEADEMADPRSSSRRAVESLAGSWLEGKPLAPMGFLVDLALFAFPEERLYFVAEHRGHVVAFLAAVPIYDRNGWFFEDLLRDRHAPNGTAEALVDEAMREVARRGSRTVSLGLAPLSGHVPRRLRLARALARPLYDFRGVHAFKAKLRPHAWETVYVAGERRSPWFALADGLAAFARGSVLRFGVETFARGPIAVLWLLTALLAVWTPLLALAPARFFPSPAVHAAWVTFDVLLGVALVSLCLRYRAWLGRLLVSAVTLDALLTLAQAIAWNLPRARGAFEHAVIAFACAGPALAALALRGMVRRQRA
jgi:phosphatidylglycerol lysyltransferase